MSVYSGFATRQQQKKYNDLLQLSLTVLAKRIIKFYHQQTCDEHRYEHNLLQIYNKMIKMEQSKYLQPHFSYILREMIVEVQPFMKKSVKEDVQVHFDADPPEEKEHKVRINTMQQMVKEFQDAYQHQSESKHSLKTTAHMPEFKVRSRVKTFTPEKKPVLHYLTPQNYKKKVEEAPRNISFHNQEEYKYNLQHTFGKNMESQTIPTVPKIDKPLNNQYNRQKQQLSPRQFLRRTIMGQKQSTNPIPTLRARQKFPKKVKL